MWIFPPESKLNFVIRNITCYDIIRFSYTATWVIFPIACAVNTSHTVLSLYSKPAPPEASTEHPQTPPSPRSSQTETLPPSETPAARMLNACRCDALPSIASHGALPHRNCRRSLPDAVPHTAYARCGGNSASSDNCSVSFSITAHSAGCRFSHLGYLNSVAVGQRGFLHAPLPP